MESFGVIIIIIIIFAAILLTVYISSPRKQYEKAIENSTGIDRVRLVIRKNSTLFGNGLKKQGNEDSLWFSVSLSTVETYHVLTDCFYTMLKDGTESWENKDLFNELSTVVASDKKKEREISSKMFGIAFGIVIKRAADAVNAKVKKTATKQFINSCEFDADCKKDIFEMTSMYLDLETSNTKTKWEFLERMTYELIGAKIKRDENDIADPIVGMSLKGAIAYARNGGVKIDLNAIKKLKEEGIIETVR